MTGGTDVRIDWKVVVVFVCVGVGLELFRLEGHGVVVLGLRIFFRIECWLALWDGVLDGIYNLTLNLYLL